jgi:1,4-alpha-glucan branching enzyme
MTHPASAPSVSKGYLAIVLHAHLPYVRHEYQEGRLEERWFFEAMLETYLPFIEVFDRLILDHIHFRISLSMTPTLLALCTDTLMKERFGNHLEQLIRLAEQETLRLQNDKRLLPLALAYLDRFRTLQSVYHSCEGDIVSKFKTYQEQGYVQILTSGATHGYLPLMKNEEAIRAQLAAAVRDYERHFGQSPQGIWLPECGYTPGLDRLLREYGIDFFVSDMNAVRYASPRPNRELYAPLLTPYGIHAFARDPESAVQVWSSDSGYPGDYDYREYYRDIGWDLGWSDPEEWEYIKPYVLPTHDRVNTGIKYYRITGKLPDKEPYDFDLARRKAQEHARNFMFNRQKQAEHWQHWLDRKPIIVSPYDAELFGHWWYEGPIWIEELCRAIFYEQNDIKMITLSEYLLEYPLSDTGTLAESSWGRNHSSEVWLQGDNAWIYRHLHEAEDRMIRLATLHETQAGYEAIPAPLLTRILNQAARELLLAQSSDWAFIMDSRTVVDYAVRRTKDHLGCFHRLCDLAEAGYVHPEQSELLAKLERVHPILPNIDYRDYARVYRTSPIPNIPNPADWQQLLTETKGKQHIFMLAWEYPPKCVGGLARAVCELAEALAAQGGLAVHVVTNSHFGSPYFECQNGVYVHRLPVMCSGDTDFYHWVFEMNLAMIDHVVRWQEAGGPIDLIHAHDWMVLEAARELKHSFRIPLVATIHATEWGRNHGRLATDIQHQIHRKEWELTYEASRVFVCSEYMKSEVLRLFELPPDKVEVYPNGIRLSELHEEARFPDQLYVKGMLSCSSEDRILFTVGRLVYEKGFQTLIDAMPLILQAAPRVKLVIGGYGPMENELRKRAAGLGDRIHFTGYLDDETKEMWYQAAEVCVVPSHYEPFGIVALESMRSGKPLVVSDTGGLAEIIEHGKNGYKALPGHAESLAWHISELFLEPMLGKQLAEAAYRKLRTNYQWDSIARQVSQSYQRLTGSMKELSGSLF